MRAFALTLLFAVGAVAQDKAAALDGTYTVKEFDRAGKAVPDAVREKVSAVKIAGGKLTITAGGKELVAVLKPDPAKKPAEIDLLPQGEADKGRKFPGLYKLEADQLTIVFVEDGERPKDFNPTAPSATKLVLVKK
jgi:uncharacterized protein (TIGR03067 family)